MYLFFSENTKKKLGLLRDIGDALASPQTIFCHIGIKLLEPVAAAVLANPQCESKKSPFLFLK